jgi:hypothetical protein
VNFRTPRTLRATLDETRRITRDPRLLMWSMVVLLFPFYLFESGLPQFADIVASMLLITLLRSWNGRLANPLSRSLASLITFIAYVILVNAAWSVVSLTFSINAKEGFLIAPTYYIFNGLMFFTFLLMFQRYGERLLWITVRLVLASVLIQVTFALVMRGAVGRSTVMFNNPNQLGYYALLSACLLLLGQKRLKLSTLQVTIGLAACSYLSLISASKAALASIAALGIALLITRIRTMIVAGLVFGVLIFTDNPFSVAIERAQNRIDNDQSFGFVEERGYDRIIDYPEYTVLGAGEGGYNRFKETSLIGAHELHSSMGTLFFCYGIVGSALFGVFLWRTMRRSGMSAWLIVGTGFAYSMTHQGLRFRLLWLLLGMVAALRELETRDRIARLAQAAAPQTAARPGLPASSAAVQA